MSKTDRIARLCKRAKSEKIVALLNDKDPETRQAAIQALGTLCDDKASNALIALLRSPDTETRIGAVKALGVMAAKERKEPQSKTHLQYLKSTEKDEQVIQAINETLAVISKISRSGNA
jgi:HEAT repeat protein